MRYINERKHIIINFLMNLINYHNFKNFEKKINLNMIIELSSNK